MKEHGETPESPPLLDASLSTLGSYASVRLVALSVVLLYMSSCCVLAVLSLRRAKLYSNWDVLTSDEKRKYAAFERTDRKRLSLVYTALGGFFLVSFLIGQTDRSD